MFYGVDPGDENFKAACFDNTGIVPKRMSCSLLPEYFGKFKRIVTKEDYVAVESTTNAFWFIDQIKDLVKECYIINTWKFSTIYRTNKKTDKIDAEKIAARLKYYILFNPSDVEFPLVYMPAKEVREVRSLFTVYDIYKRQKNMNKNMIRSLLKQNGIFGFKKANLSYQNVQKNLTSAKMSDTVRAEIESLLSIINFLENKMEETKKQIMIAGKMFQKEIDLLVSIMGISIFMAIGIMADVVDINRFKNVKHFCSYLRAAPGIDASGNTVKIGHLNKQSRYLTMTLMVESINHFRKSSRKMDLFYLKKSKGKTKGKARVALVRKVLVAIYWMLKNGEYYRYIDQENHKTKMNEYERILKKAA